MIKAFGALVALACTVAGFGAALAMGGGDHKVTICHVPPGNPGNAHTIEVDKHAVPAHLEHGDTLGACGDDTTPTDTTPTTPTDTTPTTPTETTPTTPTPTIPTPPHEVTGSADVYCDYDHYVVTGKIDGQAADSVSPATIPGTYRGWTNVTVTRGDTSHRTAVFTYGDCKPGATSTSTGSTATTASTAGATSSTSTTPTKAAPAPKPDNPPVKLTGDPKKDKCVPKAGLLECKTPTGETVTVVPGNG